MPKLPRLRGKELIAALRRADFDIIRVRAAITSCVTQTVAARLFPFTPVRPSGLGSSTRYFRMSNGRLTT